MTKLAQRLRQLRPWRLDSLAEIMQQHYGLVGQVLQLIQTHFPRLLKVDKGEDLRVFETALSTFLSAVNEEYFPLDWGYIDTAYDLYQQLPSDEDGEPCFLDLANGIPVACFVNFPDVGFDDPEQDWLNNRIYALLNCLMNGASIPNELLESKCFDSSFVAGDFQEAILNYDSSHDREPFSYLSEIAVLLTSDDHPYQQNPFLNPMGRPMGDYPVDYYTWQDDIPRLRQMWEEAYPLTEMMSNFNDYLSDQIGLDSTLTYLWSLYNEHRTIKRSKSPRLVDVFATASLE